MGMVKVAMTVTEYHNWLYNVRIGELPPNLYYIKKYSDYKLSSTRELVFGTLSKEQIHKTIVGLEWFINRNEHPFFIMIQEIGRVPTFPNGFLMFHKKSKFIQCEMYAHFTDKHSKLPDFQSEVSPILKVSSFDYCQKKFYNRLKTPYSIERAVTDGIMKFTNEDY